MQKNLSKIALWLLPLCLFGNIIFNVVFMLIGIEQDSTLRRIFVYGSLLAASLSFYLCAEYRKIKYEIASILFFYFLYFIKFLFFYNHDIVLFLKSEYIELILSFIFFGGIIVLSSNITKLYKIVWAYSIVVGTIAFIYLVYNFFFANCTTDFGWIDYLSVSSLFTHFLIILYINISQRDLTLHEKIVTGIIFSLLIAGIVRTECRREILSIFALVIFMALISIAWKTKKYLYLIAICIFTFIAAYYAGINSHNSRNLGREIHGQEIVAEIEPKIDISKLDDTEEIVTKENETVVDREKILKRLKKNTSTSFVYEKKDLDYIKNSIKWAQHVYDEIQLIKKLHSKYDNLNNSMYVLIDYVSKSQLVEKDYAAGIISTKEYLDIYSDYNFLNHTSLGGRLYLYGNAFFEFTQSPIIGNGIFYFSHKYGVEAHCIPLEIMCDFGMLGIILMAGYVFICGKYFIKFYIKKN